MNSYYSKNISSKTLKNESFFLNEEIYLEPKDHLAIVGGDGFLRSNYLYLMAGLLDIYYGELKIFDFDLKYVNYETIKKIRTRLCFVFDEGGLISNINLYDNLILPLRYHFKNFSKKYMYKRIDRFLNYFNIEAFKYERPGNVDKETYKLFLYCRAFLSNPLIIYLNEPFLFLGSKSKKYILDYLYRLQYTSNKILISSFSDIEIAYSMANKFLVLNQDGVSVYFDNKDTIIEYLKSDLYIRELFKGCGVQ
jgi:phospholipid/cholesterol/gamma-HCH transport system ATP-binding protein